MNTIQSQWELFQKMAIPEGAHPEQIIDMKRSFYAGAAAYVQLQFQITDDSISDEAGQQMFAALMEEIHGYVSLVNAGHA